MEDTFGKYLCNTIYVCPTSCGSIPNNTENASHHCSSLSYSLLSLSRSDM